MERVRNPSPPSKRLIRTISLAAWHSGRSPRLNIRHPDYLSSRRGDELLSRLILKTIEPYFSQLWNRTKTAELRHDDHALVGFHRGQAVEFRCWSDDDGYSPYAVVATISEVTKYPDALKDGWVMLSLDHMINVIDNKALCSVCGAYPIHHRGKHGKGWLCKAHKDWVTV